MPRPPAKLLRTLALYLLCGLPIGYVAMFLASPFARDRDLKTAFSIFVDSIPSFFAPPAPFTPRPFTPMQNPLISRQIFKGPIPGECSWPLQIRQRG